MSNRVFILLSFVLLYSCTTVINNPEITEQELKYGVQYLASEKLEGRLAGSHGGLKAANFIRNEFRKSGLVLVNQTGFQPFDVVLESTPGPGNLLTAGKKEFVLFDDYIPMEYSAEDTVEATICFTGFGFDFERNGLAWHDYNGIDVTGKWIMVLRGSPEWDNNAYDLMEYSEDIYKSILARDQGATGVLLVAGPSFSPDDKLDFSGLTQRSAGIPVLQITRRLADSLLSSIQENIASLEQDILKKNRRRSFEIPVVLRGITDIEMKSAVAQNVVGILEGNDPVLKDEYIVVGAHFDHLGTGGKGSSSRKPDTVAIHCGADDNASGTAALIELAEKFSASSDHLRRSLIFAAFDAEELGLLGSKAFMRNLPVDSGSITAMINIDMIGRLDADRPLSVGGTGTSAEGDSLLKSLIPATGMKVATTPDGYGPSDHATFYAKNIPVFFFTTGPHLEYHTPDDKPSTLDYGGLKTITNLICELVFDLNTRIPALTYREAGPKSPAGYSRKRHRITLGIMPDFAGIETSGLRADLVIKGQPAYAGGMKNGDIIVNINGMQVKNIDDYMFCLARLKAGETIHVEVLREGELKVLLIQL